MFFVGVDLRARPCSVEQASLPVQYRQTRMSDLPLINIGARKPHPYIYFTLTLNEKRPRLFISLFSFLLFLLFFFL